MPRRYRSRCRAEAAHETRERILGAVAAELAGGADELQVGKLATRAGVSVRTVYQHFPDRASLMDAAATWLDEQTRVPEPGLPTLDDLERQTSARIAAYQKAPALFRAQQSPGLRGRKKRRAGRDRRLREAVAAVAPAPASANDARLAAAVIGAVTSVDVAVALEDRGVSDGDLARSMQWLVRVLVAAVRRGSLP